MPCSTDASLAGSTIDSIRQASAESRPPKLASDVLADEVREHDAPQEMSGGEATGDKVIVPIFILANAQCGIEYRLVMN
jgi:hypothetical protein